MVGRHLGRYEIVELLGKGGMGEVYRARDPRLQRDVAIKVLPARLADDPERMARLGREAELLARLDHPNVATIHGMEEDDGITFLVMQLAEGPTLADRLAGEPLPVEDALVIALQVARGLEAAHGQGIVHRDLKPSNVVAAEAASGPKVKILDFGLAKAFAGAGGPDDVSPDPADPASPSRSPTRRPATATGMVLGTAPYMSPEQARGKQVDQRTDVWALGCLLYEMLAGRRAFAGTSVSETMAEILKEDPDWEALPASTPSRIRILLERCLRKDPERRLQHVGDARLEIEDALERRSVPGAAAPGSAAEAGGAGPREVVGSRQPPGPRGALALPWLLAAAATTVAVAAVWIDRGGAPGPAPVVRATIATPEDVSDDANAGFLVAVARDGGRIAYTGRSGGAVHLHVRDLDADEPTRLPGTEGAHDPFFSPDGSSIAFFADDRLRKVSLDSGVVETLAEVLVGIGGTWTDDGWIYYTPRFNQGIWRVRAEGGTPEAVTEPEPGAGEAGHYWPRLLPGGKRLMFGVELAGRPMEDTQIAVHSLETGERRTLVAAGQNAHLAPTGHLVYVRGRSLIALPFDLEELEPTGPPHTVATGLAGPTYSLSEAGALVYVAGPPARAAGQVVWVDRDGGTSPVALPGRDYLQPRLSPDGTRMVVEARGADDHLWVHEFDRGTNTRLTFEMENLSPLWTPDGAGITFARHSSGPPEIHTIPADGGDTTRVHGSEFAQFPTSWSPDGRQLLYHAHRGETGIDVMTLSVGDGPEAHEFVATRFDESQATFSPDGRWVAYTSTASGRREVHVRASDPASAGQWQVSTDGGAEPVWHPGGGELFYRDGDRLMTVPYGDDDGFEPGAPELVFTGPLHPGDFGANYDVVADGSRFLMVHVREQPAGSREIRLVLNWFEELGRRAP